MEQPQLPNATKIPPPPPLPPPPQQPRGASKLVAPKFPGFGISSGEDVLPGTGTNVEVSRTPFHPCHMFLYGTLTDPEVLQSVLHLPDLPTTMTPATISGFQVKMWGIYPALIPSDTGKVTGRIWKVTSEEHFNRLAAYETAAYTWVQCDANLEDGEVVEGCRTFCWAGDRESKELEDGSFDLERYQKYFKASVTRRRPHVEGT